MELNDKIPFDREAEMSLLGSMILDANIIHEISSLVKKRDFVLEEHQDMYQGMLDFFYQDGIDRMSVRDLVMFFKTEGRFRTIESGGIAHFIAQIAQAAPVTSHWKYYAERIRLVSIKRDCYESAIKMMSFCQDQKSKETQLLSAIGEMQTAVANIDESKVHDLHDVLMREIVNKSIDGTLSKSTGHSSSIPEWDALTGGLCPGLHVIAARPSVGKSTIGPVFVESVVKATGIPSLTFHLEMEASSMAWREWARLTGIKQSEVRMKVDDGGLTAREKAEYAAHLDNIPKGMYFVYDKAETSIQQIIGMAKSQHSRTGLSCVMVDYIQLITVESSQKSRHEEVGGISGKLKGLSKDLGIPVIALGQLNRGGDISKPTIKEMSQSDKISMDADTITLIHRKSDEDNSSFNSSSKESTNDIEELVLTIDKARDGQRGRVEVDHHRGLFRIKSKQVARDEKSAEDFAERKGEFSGWNAGDDKPSYTQNDIPFDDD